MCTTPPHLSGIAPNTTIDAMKHIQLIEKQNGIFRLNIGDLHTKPINLFTDGLFPLAKVIKGSTLGWHVKGKFISYNQLKKAINEKS